ncbi:hypothetical protein IAT40_006981 [Kwoniella sp. CBS 6097]
MISDIKSPIKSSINVPIELDYRPQTSTEELDKQVEIISNIRVHWRAFVWCLQDFGQAYGAAYVVPARWQSAFNSASSIGGVFGGLSAGWIADRIGRRDAIAVACVVSTGGVFMQFFCPAHWNSLLLAGKMVNGVALGMYISCASAYCVEISPVSLRGITTGSINLWIIVGQFISNCVVKGLGSGADAWAYRIPL